MAEKEGFEPSIPFWGIHDFQSCALGQLRDFSICLLLADSLVIIQHLTPFVKYLFQKILFFSHTPFPLPKIQVDFSI